jgi:hypothetical protein
MVNLIAVSELQSALVNISITETAHIHKFLISFSSWALHISHFPHIYLCSCSLIDFLFSGLLIGQWNRNGVIYAIWNPGPTPSTLIFMSPFYQKLFPSCSAHSAGKKWLHGLTTYRSHEEGTWNLELRCGAELLGRDARLGVHIVHRSVRFFFKGINIFRTVYYKL